MIQKCAIVLTTCLLLPAGVSAAVVKVTTPPPKVTTPKVNGLTIRHTTPGPAVGGKAVVDHRAMTRTKPMINGLAPTDATASAPK